MICRADQCPRQRQPFGEVANNALGINAAQANMAGTGIGTFSDRGRGAIRGGGPFDGGVSLVAPIAKRATRPKSARFGFSLLRKFHASSSFVACRQRDKPV